MSAPWVLAGSLLALPIAYAVWRLAVRELGSRAAATVAALATLGAVSVFPDRVRSAVEGTQRFGEMPVELRDRYGSRVIADARVFRALRARIPPDATYYLQLPEPVPGTDIEIDGPFRHWTFWWLLPRVAVDSPHEADWVISRHADLDTLGVELREVRRLGPATFLGRLR